jgi:hypothetical protein
MNFVYAFTRLRIKSSAMMSTFEPRIVPSKGATIIIKKYFIFNRDEWSRSITGDVLAILNY